VISANTLWIVIFALVVLYVVARWVRARTATEPEQNEQVRYLIRSGTHAAVPELTPSASGLVVSRYYFRETDVESGPADPADFYDELFIDLRDAESAQTWQNSLHVATPRGLDRMMAEEGWDSVIGGELLIVRKYDLQTILRGATDHLQEIYEAQVKIMGAGARPPEKVG
jgi:hypothetical protein